MKFCKSNLNRLNESREKTSEAIETSYIYIYIYKHTNTKEKQKKIANIVKEKILIYVLLLSLIVNIKYLRIKIN